MRIVTAPSELTALIDDFSDAPYVAIDTEFVRERTFWPQLCLVQIARPGGVEGRDAAIIDPLVNDLDLQPLFDFLSRPDLVKVFHAARQDVEIVLHLSGAIPTPLFDTQIAAMVCGYGDQVGYETLVRKIAKKPLDKSSRFTDWSRRPLTQKQLTYALGDVTHLRQIYETLSARLAREGRSEWVAEEMSALAEPSTYETDPAEAWRKLKTRSTDGRFLAVARELAAWRERSARVRDVPRQKLLKDDALLEICANQPTTLEQLGRSRLLFRESRKGEVADEILAAVARGIETPPEDRPRLEAPKPPKRGALALTDLLRVLLKARSEEVGVAQRLIASSADLEAIANDDPPETPALHGWRREAFGADALRLKRGEIALTAGEDGVRIVDL